MDDKNAKKIENIIKERNHAHDFFMKNSKVYRTFVELEQKAFSNGKLEKKYKELIALGISICMNCESCMEWHISEALKSGANSGEIIETIEIGIEMGGGPATVASRFALKVLEYYKNKQ